MGVINFLKSGVNFNTTNALLDRLQKGVGAYPYPPYLLFSSPSTFTLGTNNNTKNWDGTLETSTDGSTWTTWDGTSAVSSSNDGKLYVRGSQNTYITGVSGSTKRWVLTGSDISCIGNIENLLDYQQVSLGNHPPMANYCYANIFSSCTALTTAPNLPATTLSDYCYNSMFLMTSITTAPQLPATTLTAYCYTYMFSRCANLTTAPQLPATTLANYCYNYMFNQCTSLTTAPNLPATTLFNSCYRNMFTGCTSLTTAPQLPATTLANYCYGAMFTGCTSLTTAPQLPATTLAFNCYREMFSSCTALTTAPQLAATTLKDYCYDSMFYYCTNLTTPPALPATTIANCCYQQMFYYCTNLISIPELPATTLANYCYNNMFRLCLKIKLSTTQTGDYVNEYRIPTTGTGAGGANPLLNMFAQTGGTFTGTPTINITYYTSNTIISAS